MNEPITATAARAAEAALAVIEAAHPDPDARRECLRLAIEQMPQRLRLRVEQQDHASRPDW